jgi:uncharacterized protein HemX
MSNKIILLFIITALYSVWVLYNSCFTQVKKLNLKFQNSQIEEADLETQLNNCEKKKIELQELIKKNQDRIKKEKDESIAKKKKKLDECSAEVIKLENKLNDLKKYKGGV